MKTRTVAYRRKREGRTDYKKRLHLLMSEKRRLVVRKSLKNITAQIIEYNKEGDKVLVSARGSELKQMGWNYGYSNIPSAYLLGTLIAKKAKEKGIDGAILDSGFNKSVPGCKVYAVVKGAKDNGLNVPASDEVMPTEERITGKHIGDFSKIAKDDKKYEKAFTKYKKENQDPEQITKVFQEVKSKING